MLGALLLFLSLSPLFFLYPFSKPKLKENNPQNRASMYMFVHVLEKEKKHNKKPRALCEREGLGGGSARVYYSEQRSIKCGPMNRE